MNGISLLLIDALALAYRAFHAIPPLTARDGTPTNAVLGFVKAVRNLRERFQPSHHAVVFDGGLPAARMEQLPEYKAQRTPMPDALEKQLPLLDEYLEAESIPRILLEGEEADDVMATLSERVAGQGGRVWIATNDKDLFQMVNDRVSIVAPVKDAPVMGPEEIREKTGVAPSAIPAWLALTGDAVDNIPGVPGVGAKTAAKLLHQFGSLHALFERIEEVPGDKLREALRGSRDLIERNLSLVTLNRDVQGLPDLDRLRVQEADAAKQRSFFSRLDMPSLAPPASASQLELF